MALIDKLTAIGDAIRAKNGTTDKLSLSGMVTAINNISTGYPNGTEWTRLTSNFGRAGFCTHNGILVTGGASGHFYSEDGITWTLSNLALSTHDLICSDGILVTSTTDGGIYYSTDGMVWTQSDIPILTEDYYNLNNCGCMWFACSNSGDGLFYYSKNGAEWSLVNIDGFIRPNVYNMVYYRGAWFTLMSEGGDYNYKLRYSKDCATWTTVEDENMPYDGDVYRGRLAVGNGMLIVNFDCIGYQSIYTVDGKTWNKFDFKFYNNSFWYIDGLWFGEVEESSNAYTLHYSNDGVTWSPTNLVSRNWYFFDIRHENRIWFAETNSYDVCNMWYSEDGVAWIESSISANSASVRIDNLPTYADGVWVCGTILTGLWYSFDGVEWTQSNVITNSYDSIYHANGIWIAFDSGSSPSYYSITWQPS